MTPRTTKTPERATSSVPSSITQLVDALAAQLLGRAREAYLIVLALIAREHVLLVGPPGTAKSRMCRSVSRLIHNSRYFERLLSPTTPPEDVWGPISLGALRSDRYEHITTGYAADCHVGFFDEVGRASPAILDGLLHLLGPERQALIGTQQIQVPLISAIGSANTWPEDAAMLDRWLLRATVQPLGAGMRRTLLTWSAPPLVSVTSLDELTAAQQHATTLPFGKSALDTYESILSDLDEAGISGCDRRLYASRSVARAACALRGGSEVESIDLEPLQYVLWTTPDQSALAGSKVVARANPVGARLNTILGDVDEIMRSAVDSTTRVAAAAKLAETIKEIEQIVKQPGSNGRAKQTLTYVKRENIRLQGAMMNLSPERIEALLGGVE